VIVHFGGGNHHPGAGLSDFAADWGIEVDEPDFAANHQARSASAALPNSPMTSASSPPSAIFLAASAQPLRTDRAGRRKTRASPSIVISTPASASRPSCARSGLGITTPCELPMGRMLT